MLMWTGRLLFRAGQSEIPPFQWTRLRAEPDAWLLLTRRHHEASSCWV